MSSKVDPQIYLAIDNCFASKRWTKPKDWSRLIAEMGVSYIEASADTECDPLYMGEAFIQDWVRETQDACAAAGVEIVNFYSGHGTYSTIGLAHWDGRVRARFRDRWIKKQAENARAFGAGLGFFTHAFDQSFLQSAERYRAALEQLYADLSDIALYAADIGLTAVGVEQMYAPHQPPWTIKGARELLASVFARSGAAMYITADLGHMNGQQYFRRPGADLIRSVLSEKRGGKSPGRTWFGSAKATSLLKDALQGKTDDESAIEQILIDCEHNPHLFADERDADVYAWLEELACFSPIIHLQQSDGTSSPHWPFDAVHNEKGIIDGEKVMRAIAASYGQEAGRALPPFRPKLYLTLEPFIGTASNPYDAIEEIADSVAYWRRFIPEDGLSLSSIIHALDRRRGL